MVISGINVKQKIVIKIGTSTLTMGTDRISRGKIEDIARQIVKMKDQYDIVLVSSGAIATARQFVNISGWENLVASKQAMSAIGQPKLMQLYSEVFSDFGIKIAQCLMTYRDFENQESRKNTFNTIYELLQHRYIPIINENDTVGVEELILGDNDKLSALVAALMKADKLIIASDTDGLFDKNPHLHKDARLIEEVNDLSNLPSYIEEKQNGLGTGGMSSKLQAVKICLAENVEVCLTNGYTHFFIEKTLNNQVKYTRFIPNPVKVVD
jgi:glutamate 5-kinase